MLPTRAAPPTLALMLAVTACGGGGGGSATPTMPGTGGGGGDQRSIKADPSFQDDVFEIFQRRGCTSGACHGGGIGGLTMSSVSTAYDNLVDQPAAGASGEVLVIPGDAAKSYLVKKLEGASDITGVRMPKDSDPLDSIDLTNVENWIDKGAAKN